MGGNGEGTGNGSKITNIFERSGNDNQLREPQKCRVIVARRADPITICSCRRDICNAFRAVTQNGKYLFIKTPPATTRILRAESQSCDASRPGLSPYLQSVRSSLTLSLRRSFWNGLNLDQCTLTHPRTLGTDSRCSIDQLHLLRLRYDNYIGTLVAKCCESKLD